MRHGGITELVVKIGRDGGISEPGTGPFKYILNIICLMEKL
jgi:hypothetical protein